MRDPITNLAIIPPASIPPALAAPLSAVFGPSTTFLGNQTPMLFFISFATRRVNPIMFGGNQPVILLIAGRLLLVYDELGTVQHRAIPVERITELFTTTVDGFLGIRVPSEHDLLLGFGNSHINNNNNNNGTANIPQSTTATSRNGIAGGSNSKNDATQQLIAFVVNVLCVLKSVYDKDQPVMQVHSIPDSFDALEKRLSLRRNNKNASSYLPPQAVPMILNVDARKGDYIEQLLQLPPAPPKTAADPRLPTKRSLESLSPQAQQLLEHPLLRPPHPRATSAPSHESNAHPFLAAPAPSSAAGAAKENPLSAAAAAPYGGDRPGMTPGGTTEGERPSSTSPSTPPPPPAPAIPHHHHSSSSTSGGGGGGGAPPPQPVTPHPSHRPLAALSADAASYSSSSSSWLDADRDRVRRLEERLLQLQLENNQLRDRLVHSPPLQQQQQQQQQQSIYHSPPPRPHPHADVSFYRPSISHSTGGDPQQRESDNHRRTPPPPPLPAAGGESASFSTFAQFEESIRARPVNDRLAIRQHRVDALRSSVHTLLQQQQGGNAATALRIGALQEELIALLDQQRIDQAEADEAESERVIRLHQSVSTPTTTTTLLATAGRHVGRATLPPPPSNEQGRVDVHSAAYADWYIRHYAPMTTQQQQQQQQTAPPIRRTAVPSLSVRSALY